MRKIAGLLALAGCLSLGSVARADAPLASDTSVQITPTEREASRVKLYGSLVPAVKPKVDNIIAILIGLLVQEKPMEFQSAFEAEMKKAFPRADAQQLSALQTLIALQVAKGIENRLAERRVHLAVVHALVACKKDNACFEKATSGVERAQIETMRKELEGKTKDLDAQEKLDNFEIQRLQTSSSKMGKLLSNISKKEHDTAQAIINNIKG